jgi:PAS domain S-box-containing protein
MKFFKSEAKYKRLYETSQDGIMARDLEGCMIDCNPAYMNMLGYSKDELKTLSIKQILPDKWHEQREEVVKKVIEDGDSIVFEREYIRKDGNIFPASVRTWRLTNENDEVIGVWSVVRDITEIKKAEEALRESEERFKLVAEAANVMVYETDFAVSKTKIIRGSKELIGFEPDQIDFTVDWILSRIHPDDAPKVLLHFRTAEQEDEVKSLEYRFLHKNGNYIIVKDTAKVVRDSTGKIARLIGGVRDITQRRDNEARIEQYNRHLEIMVEERTKQLKEAERLAAIGATAGMVGHDIRNPLQAMISDVFLAKSDLESMPEGEAKEGLKESLIGIEKNIAYINKIVADLQDYARPLKPELVEVVDFCSVIQEIVDSANIPSDIDISLSCNRELPKLKIELTFLKRILLNLITNAVQAMPNGGKLEIAAFEKNCKLVISVQDTGVGISDDVKPKIFLPMMSTKAKGQGLGLAVVKRLVEAQGGTINFKSEAEEGTIFTVELPFHI